MVRAAYGLLTWNVLGTSSVAPQLSQQDIFYKPSTQSRAVAFYSVRGCGQPAVGVVGGHVAKWSVSVVEVSGVAEQLKAAKMRSLFGKADSPGSPGI